jgi:hypothetical protein
MILRGGAKTLTKAVTKPNRLGKCQRLTEVVDLFTKAQKK